MEQNLLFGDTEIAVPTSFSITNEKILSDNAGTSSSSYTYTAEAGTAGKRRLYFLQQGAEKNVLTVKDLPDCGIIDTTYLATIWDIYPADAFSPTFVYSKSYFCYVICEITMKEE